MPPAAPILAPILAPVPVLTDTPAGTVASPAPGLPRAPDQRSAGILASVRDAFAEKGFDGASMQDLARASGMSVGNFYRYFPSKSAIVEALISSDLDEIEEVFRAILDSPHPMQALREMLGYRIRDQQNATQGQLWSEISAVSRRKPEIRAVTVRMETQITDYMLQTFAAETRLPLDEVKARFAAHAAFIILLIKSVSCFGGAAQDAAFESKRQDDLNRLILRTIDSTLAEISAATHSSQTLKAR